jgi:hypothetical protein
MKKSDLIKMKVNEAIEAGKDKEGNVIKIPVFHSIMEIDGELYGEIEGYVNTPAIIAKEKPDLH